MTEQKTTLADEAMQVARRLARVWRLTEDETLDAISIAWEFSLPGRGSPASIGWYAVKRVRSARRFAGQSVRSADSPAQRPDKPVRSDEIDPADLAKPGADPAKVAALRIDFGEWIEALPQRPRQVALALANGEQTSELAQQLGCTSGRISQMRRELESHWRDFQG